ncbi:tetratricopeptide repeat protein [candidate division KSB1 bacterium]|nr:tetratricopeptide repeat protein [candidate division KSB1 bacterium]
MIRALSSLLILVMVFGVLIGCGQKMTKEQMFALAEKYEKEGNYTESLKVYQKITKKFSSTELADQAQYKVAYIFSNNLNDFEKSVEAHLELLETYPESKYAAQSLFMVGFIYANNINDFEKARTYYNEFLEKYPDNELSSSVQWELNNLGKDINEIPLFNDESDTGVISEKVAK